jgi:diacylglycerol kinase (ATP)
MRVRAIVNPRAGVAFGSRVLKALSAGRPAWDTVEVELTRAPGHARELAEEVARRGDPFVLAVGGDGTVNEVATGLLGASTALGIVPQGSGNGLARALGLSLRPSIALAQLETAVRRRMDVGWANGRLFLNVAGSGFDATVAHAFHSWGRRGGRRGIFSYVWLSLRVFVAYRMQSRRLEICGKAEEGPALLTLFSNGPQYGAGAVAAPRAKLDDGLLDVVTFEMPSVMLAMAGVPRLFLGGIERYGGYRCTQAARATLETPSAVAFHRDGEPEAPADFLEIRLEERALEVLVPPATANDPAGPFTVGDVAT